MGGWAGAGLAGTGLRPEKLLGSPGRARSGAGLGGEAVDPLLFLILMSGKDILLSLRMDRRLQSSGLGGDG